MTSKAILFAPADRQQPRGRSESIGTRPGGPRLALFPVGNRPLVEHALEELTAAGIDDIAVVSDSSVGDEVGRVVEEWQDASRTITHTRLERECSFIDALQSVRERVEGEPFVVHLCDSLRRDGVAPAIEPGPAGSHDVLALVQDGAQEATPLGAGLASVQTAGVYIFGPAVLDLADDADAYSVWDTQIAAVAERMAAAGGRLEIRPVHECWRYQRRPDILLQANRFFLSGLKPRMTDAWLENTDLQGPVVIDPTARLRSSTVRGPVIIGPGAEISDAYIGPYSSIGRDVTIENAEVEHSIILPGASIRHLGGRLEASVVGPGAKIFRDFRLPRALRLNIGEGAEVALT
jgi:glucose-1-phosphate thymidylyltransferase